MATNTISSSSKCRLLLLLILLTMSYLTSRASNGEEGKLLAQFHNSKGDVQKISSLIKLSQFYVNKEGNVKNDMTRALKYAEDAIRLSKKSANSNSVGLASLVLSQIYREDGNNNIARKFALNAIGIFQANPVKMLELADANLELSNTFTIDNDKEVLNKITYYEKGVGLLRKAVPNSMKLADALKFFGELQSLNNRDTTALKCLDESLKIYKSIGYGKVQDVYSLIGTIYTARGDVNAAMRYLIQASNLAEKYKDSSSTIISLHNRIGLAYYNMSQFENSTLAFKKSIALADHNHDTGSISVVSTNLSRAYLRLDNPKLAIKAARAALNKITSSDTAGLITLNTILIEAYIVLEDPNNALQNYQKIEKLVKKNYTLPSLEANFYNASTKLFFLLKDYDRMEISLEKFRKVSEKINNIIAFIGVERQSFRLDSARGKPWSAIQHLKKFQMYSDSLNKRSHDKELARIQAEFDSQKKDQDIREKNKDIGLLKKQTELQGRAFSSERNSRNLLVIGVVLLAALLILAYSRYQIKRKANFELNKKQISINEQNLSLKQLLSEREYLLKEVHHRVKNNLQIIISLLDSQSVFLTDDGALGVIRESQNRIASISLIHQKLYQDDSLPGIETKEYISELVNNMKESFSVSSNLKFSLDVDPVILDVSQAVPLGLILNECITNAIKYAFKGSGEGTINVKLKNIDEVIELVVADNGHGLPLGFDTLKSPTLGMSLIHGLATQLKGNVVFLSNSGLRVTIRFPKVKILKDNTLSMDLDFSRQSE